MQAHQKERSQQFVVKNTMNVDKAFSTALEGVTEPITDLDTKIDLIVVTTCLITGTDYGQFLSRDRFEPLNKRRFRCWRTLRSLLMYEVTEPMIGEYFGRASKTIHRGLRLSDFEPLLDLPVGYVPYFCQATQTPVDELFRCAKAQPLPVGKPDVSRRGGFDRRLLRFGPRLSRKVS